MAQRSGGPAATASLACTRDRRRRTAVHVRQLVRPRLAGCTSRGRRRRRRRRGCSCSTGAGRRARPRRRPARVTRRRRTARRQRTPPGATPIAQAYAGHQFGGFSPRLGDGRALLLGELVDDAGRRRDLHLKGSGRTPFARGGDGKAAVGPMLREYVIGEAMHALGIPTTRALAVVATGEPIAARRCCPARCSPGSRPATCASARSSTRPATTTPALLRRLADYAIARHYPRRRRRTEPVPRVLRARSPTPGRARSPSGCSSASSTA